MLVAGAAFGSRATLFRAVICFIRFNEFALAAERASLAGRLHRFADAMRHEPSGLVGNPQHPVKLVGADALLRRSHEVRGEQPLVQRDMRPLKNRARPDREFAPAIVAKKHSCLRLSAHLAALVRSAERAIQALTPTRGLHMLYGLGFVIENRVREIGGHWSFPL